MNILKTNFFIKKSNQLKMRKENNQLVVENNSNDEVTIIVPKIFKTNNLCFEIVFEGDVIVGENGGIIAKLVSKTGNVFLEVPFNNKLYTPKKANIFMMALRVMPNSKVVIKKLELNFIEKYESEIKKGLDRDTVLIVPGYPSNERKYNFSFVHSKVRQYKKLGWNIDVLVVTGEEESSKYEFEGINVTKTNYLNARNILQENKYKKIIVHFFNDEYVNLLDSVDTSESEIYIYSHGADLIYRDYNLMTTKYFNQTQEITNTQAVLYAKKDKILERYNKKENVKWIFGTNWAKNRAEELNNIKFNKYYIIPCIIDDTIFKFQPKKAEYRKKIFSIKKFDDINTYSVDILVRTILELSKREIFNSLEFNIYGDGTEFDRLVEPIKKFNNVNLYKKFLTHEEIAKVHKENGIGFFPTRYETQGVSASEAAMSGLVVVSGNTAAVPEVFDGCGILCNKEDYVEYANAIEYLYNNPEKFEELSIETHNKMLDRFGSKKVINSEIEMFNNNNDMKVQINVPEQEDVILTIAIASYNVEKYLKNGVLSLLQSRVASKLEILIINDGSKDNTAQIGKELERLTTVNGKSIVKLIDKENGGHGSTINKGIECATGKYFKLMDGDDYFDTTELEKLVEILEKEDCDIVLNNYVEDLAVYSTRNEMYLYDFMVPGFKYNLEDLCEGEYGFDKWGPLLSTSTYKTKMLQEANFKISEKCFYVDMELNTYAFISAKTIMYYPLNLYIYYIGRAGQSVSRESYTRNYKNHEHVTLKLIKEYYENNKITEKKKVYIKNKIIIPLVKCQYMISTDFFNNGVAFRSFDSKLKQYPEFYNYINEFKIKINRFTNGSMIKITHIIDAIKRRLKK